MNCMKGSLYIFLLFITSGVFHVKHLYGKKEILKTGTCSSFSQSVWSENKAPRWSLQPCSICNALNEKKSWIGTKFFPTQRYKLINVDVEVVRAKCNKCANRFVKAYILHQNNPILQKQDNVEAVVKFLDSLPLLKTFDLRNKSVEKPETFHIQFVPKKSEFSVVFRSEGGCTRVLDMSFSAFYCEKNVSRGVILPHTIAPAEGVERVNVSCPINTLNPGNEEAYGLCSSDGNWEIVSPCMCKKGFTLDTINEGCKDCDLNTYKDTVGNEKCTACPKNSQRVQGQLQCQCKEGHHHFLGENYRHPCYGIPSAVRDVTFDSKTDTTVRLLWKPPERSGTPDQDVKYDVECRKCKSSSDSGPCDQSCGSKVTYKPSQRDLLYTNVTVLHLEKNTDYEFVVYSKNNNSAYINQTNLSKETKKVTTKAISSSGDKLPIAIIIAVPVIVIVMMIIIIVLVVCLLKRRKVRQFRRSQRLGGQPDFPLLPGERNYIDPTTYDNPERAVLEFAKELDRSLIKFESIIGGGEFGDVYKGDLKRPGQPSTKVAIKTLKAGCTHKNRTDFLIEASVMGQFKNLNVISLEGVVTKTTPLLIVIEYMENGSLDRYLKVNDGTLKPLQLLEMARGCASGMEYLASMHFVHRDLAARNILVNANFACKVADFGLSRDIGKNEDSEYETQGGKIPVRWTAPEAITYRKFSTASDVWSYGILLWEIMSFAERPYWNWGNEEVMTRVDQGYRLPAPMNCPKIVHQLMKECWTADRTKRPPFKEIVRILDEWIKCPDKLNEDYIKVRRTEPLDYSTFTSVKDWLEAIKMGMYATNFSKAGYEELSDVAGLTEDELLKKVGVRLVGHRHKIYQRIKEMSEEMKLKREQSVRI